MWCSGMAGHAVDTRLACLPACLCVVFVLCVCVYVSTDEPAGPAAKLAPSEDGLAAAAAAGPCPAERGPTRFLTKDLTPGAAGLDPVARVIMMVSLAGSPAFRFYLPRPASLRRLLLPLASCLPWQPPASSLPTSCFHSHLARSCLPSACALPLARHPRLA